MTRTRKPSRWQPVNVEVEKGSPTRPSQARQTSLDRLAEMATERVLSGLSLTGSRLVKY